jgi:hypothetical protein
MLTVDHTNMDSERWERGATLGIKSSTSLCLIDALSPHGKAERNHIHKIRVLTAIKVDTLLLRLSLSFNVVARLTVSGLRFCDSVHSEYYASWGHDPRAHD